MHHHGTHRTYAAELQRANQLAAATQREANLADERVGFLAFVAVSDRDVERDLEWNMKAVEAGVAQVTPYRFAGCVLEMLERYVPVYVRIPFLAGDAHLERLPAKRIAGLHAMKSGTRSPCSTRRMRSVAARKNC